MNLSAVSKFKKGFSLIEILIFISVFSVALVSLVASVTYSALMLNEARYRLMATRVSEELAEWLKFQRDFYGFDNLNTYVGTGPTYCFNLEDLSSWPSPSGSCNNNYDLLNIYQRELTLASSPGLITATITTSWIFLTGQKEVTITTRFNDY